MSHDNTCPLPQKKLIDEYFMEQRNKLLEVAAFLDRLDRSVERNGADDFRLVAFRKALEVLSEEGPGRAQRVQMLLSDAITNLLEERDQQGAFGASARTEGAQ
jgi:hypothetical protein